MESAAAEFLYRAKASSSFELAAIDLGDGNSIQVMAQQRQQAHRPAQRVLRPGKGAFAAPPALPVPTLAKPAPAEVKPDVATESPAETEGGRPPPADEPSAKRRGVESSVAQAPPPVHALPKGLVRVPNPGKGDCLFYALSEALPGNKGCLVLRASMVAHMRRHSARYEGYWNATAPTREETHMDSWSAYLDALALTGAWTSCLEIWAVAVHFDCPILMFSPTMPPQVFNREGKKHGPFMLWFEAGHFELVKGEIPQDLLSSAITAARSGCRGGSAAGSGHTRLSAWGSHSQRQSTLIESFAAGSVPHSGHTRLSALPAGVVPVAASRPLSPHANADGGSPLLAHGSYTDDLPACLGDLADFEVPVEEPAPSSSINRHKRRSWTCPICQWTTGVRTTWSQRKRSHILAWHADRLRHLDLARLPDLIQKDLGPCSWTCPLCDLGIPVSVSDADVHYRMRRKHAETMHPDAPRRSFLVRNRDRDRTKRQCRLAANSKINFGVARRLHQVRQGQHGQHTVEFLRLPLTEAQTEVRSGNRVRRRTSLIPKAFCATCRRLAPSVPALGNLPCSSEGVGGPKRVALLRRLRQISEDCGQPILVREQATVALRKLTIPVPVPNGQHVIEAILWPLTPSQASVLCTTCLRTLTRERTLARTACPGHVAWSARRQALLRTLDLALPDADPERDQRIRTLRRRLHPAALDEAQ